MKDPSGYFEAILNATMESVFLVDIRGYVLAINETAASRLGRSRQDIEGRVVFDFFPPEVAAQRRAHFDAVAQSGLHRATEDMRGSRHFAMNYFPVRNGQGVVEAVAVFATDITERKTSENALRLTQERLALAQRAAGAGVWDWPIGEEAMFWSDEMCQLFGLPVGSNLVSLETWRAAVHPLDLAGAQERNAAAIRDHTPLSSEYRVVLPGGQIRWIAAYGSTSYDANDKALRMTGISVDISDRKLLEEALQESEQRYRAALMTSPDAINITRLADGSYLEVSDGFVRMTGWQRDEVIGKTSIELRLWDHSTDRQRLMDMLRRDGYYENQEVNFRARDGRLLEGLMSAHLITMHGEQCLLSVSREITQRKQAERALRESKELTEAIVENTPLMVFLKDATDLRYVLFNRAGEELTGFERSSLLGKNDYDLFPPEQAAHFIDMDRQVLGRAEQVMDISEEPVQTVHQGKRLLHTRKVCIRGVDGQPKYLLGISEDITQRRAAEDEIRNLAYYDPLTRLPNRRLLTDRLRQVLATSERHGKQVALLFIDLDNFKILNDNLGHHIGDQLLQQVTGRLLGCVRKGDTVARLGGDEFVVMLEDLSPGDAEASTQAETVGRQILAMLNQTYHFGGYDHHSTASIGITLFAGQQETIDDLLKRADLAMYQAKAGGRNTLRFFDPEMQSMVTRRAALEADLREAVTQEQFVVYYQPQVTDGVHVSGAEALLRWRHARRGLVQPHEFIALAEDTGLILSIGHWVIRNACAQLALWANVPQLAHLTIAVNVSARQFHHVDFVDQVHQALRQSGADPHKLKLELTESLLVQDVEDVIAKMSALRDCGVRFSLDDFGTGYSSLQYLKRLPLEQLKIDQGFIRDILTDPNDAAIANMVIALAHSMGLSVIAEGVETQEQRDFLAAHDCLAYQGYLLAHPLPLDAFEKFVLHT
jgi:diguanylate cyclase (GGDEF)-like protein/PAS domain S-box-containing protein